MNRRSVLGVLASTSLTGIAGCLGDSGNDGAKPATTPIMNREVPIGGDIGGVIPQFQGSPEHTGNLDATGPTDGVTTYWRRTPHRYDHSQPVVVDDRVYVSFGENSSNLTVRQGSANGSLMSATTVLRHQQCTTGRFTSQFGTAGRTKTGDWRQSTPTAVISHGEPSQMPT